MSAEQQRALNPVVLPAIKVLCEASEDEVMNALEEFRVAHRSRLSALLSQSVAEGLAAYKQQGDHRTFDAASLVGAIFGSLADVPAVTI